MTATSWTPALRLVLCLGLASLWALGPIGCSDDDNGGGEDSASAAEGADEGDAADDDKAAKKKGKKNKDKKGKKNKDKKGQKGKKDKKDKGDDEADDADDSNAVIIPPPPPSKGDKAGRHPLVVVGMDGADWTAIRKLWAESALPNLKALCDKGTCAPIQTGEGGSPIIWTTVATGQPPKVHGIEGFVMESGEGDIPVNSSMRKVPALWNIASDKGLSVAVVGWWATWPAESINGVVVTDIAHDKVDEPVSPLSWEKGFKKGLKEANEDKSLFKGKEHPAAHERMVTYFTPKLVTAGYDLVMSYFRDPDVTSHHGWGFFMEPAKYKNLYPPETISELGGKVEAAYRNADAGLGKVMASLPADANLVVLSDHGFKALVDEGTTKVYVDFDSVLEKLGFLTMADDHIDMAKSRLYCYRSSNQAQHKNLRFVLDGREDNGTVKKGERAEIRAELVAALKKVTYESGKPAFAVGELGKGGKDADFKVDVLTEEPSELLLVDGKPFKGGVRKVVLHSGGHIGENPEGIFAAMGPDFSPKQAMKGLHVNDIAPTILYALGLPTAEDFPSKPRLDLFTDAYKKAHPVTTVPSYGTRQAGQVTASEVDAEQRQRLCELGYIECDAEKEEK